MRGDAEKMRAVLPFGRALSDEPYTRFVDERRRLQCVVAAFAEQIAAGDAPQFRINERQKLLQNGVAPAREIAVTREMFFRSK